MVSAPSFSQPYLCIQPTVHSPPKTRSSTSDNFHLPTPPLLVHKIILTIPTNIPFLCTSIFHLNFSSPFFSPPYLNCFANLGYDTVLTSPLWTVIIGLTITDSLSLRLRKLVYCRCGKSSNPPSLMPST